MSWMREIFIFLVPKIRTRSVPQWSHKLIVLASDGAQLPDTDGDNAERQLKVRRIDDYNTMVTAHGGVARDSDKKYEKRVSVSLISRSVLAIIDCRAKPVPSASTHPGVHSRFENTGQVLRWGPVEQYLQWSTSILSHIVGGKSLGGA